MNWKRRIQTHAYFSLFFTIIELLLVITIIAILTTLLLPALSKAREGAKRTACAGLLKQYGLCSLSYADDAGGRLPTHYNGSKTWFEYLFKKGEAYDSLTSTINGRRIWRWCPARPKTTNTGSGSNWLVNYAMANYGSEYAYPPLAFVKKPSMHSFFSDAPFNSYYPGPENCNYAYYCASETISSSWAAYPIHGNFINQLFVDGRVAPLARMTVRLVPWNMF